MYVCMYVYRVYKIIIYIVYIRVYIRDYRDIDIIYNRYNRD